MIQRTRYLEQLRPYYDKDCIKLILGLRHAGKSVLLGQIREELTVQGKQTLFLDFADPTISKECRDAQSLSSYIGRHWRRRGKRDKCYVFLDNVQNLVGWSAICRILSLSKISLFAAGSGATLLTPEAESVLAGNHLAFHVRPFVYQELLAHGTELGKTPSIEDYLRYGGFPKRLEYQSQGEMLRYLGSLAADTIQDAIGGRKIMKETLFRHTADFVLTSNGSAVNAHMVHSRLKAEGMSCSINTIAKYLDDLEASCLLRRMPVYSTRAHHVLGSRAKFYDTDVAFHTLRKPQDGADLAANLENIVYNELSYRGYALSAYEHQKESIDFLAAKDGREYFVQVAESIAEKGDREKKLRLLNTLDNSRKKLIITNDKEDYSTSVVEHIRLKDFLMMEDLRG